MPQPHWEPPLVIDFHAHLHEPGTVKWAQTQRFDRTVILAGPDNNDQVLEFCQKSDGRFMPYCFLNLANVRAAVKQVRQYAARGFRGVKFQPLTQRFLPHDEKFNPLWEAIQELRLPITSHAGTVAFPNHVACYADPSGWSRVAADFPELKIVIAHLGGNFSFQALVLAETHANVYLDTAYLAFFAARSLPQVEPIELVERAVRFAGAGKVIFASEGMTPDYIYNSPQISLSDRKLIFWKNALRVLGEPEV